DASYHGLYHPVEELRASEAVAKYGEQYDVLLLCWPPVTEEAYYAAAKFDKDVLIIGEYTNYAANMLGGCATDAFWAHAESVLEFSSYCGRYAEKAQIVRMRDSPCPRFMAAVDHWEETQRSRRTRRQSSQ